MRKLRIYFLKQKRKIRKKYLIFKKNLPMYRIIIGEAIVIFLMYAIPLTIYGLAIYGLYKLVL